MWQEQLGKKFVLLFGVAGLVSGLLTSISTYPNGQEGGLYSGSIFGLFLLLCLAAPEFVDAPWKTISKGVVMIAATTVAYFLSFLAAFELQLHFPAIVPRDERWSMGTHEPASAVALLLGGFIGGLIVFCSALLLFGPRIRKDTLLRNTLLGAVIGGVLGIAGWALRSSVGVAVWHLLHAFRLTPRWEGTPRQWYGGEYDYSETTRMYSLYVVWQTGIATALGMALRALSRRPRNTSASREQALARGVDD